MKVIFLFFLLILLPIVAVAKVTLTTSAKTPVSQDQVKLSTYDRGQYKDCEEMGVIESRNFSSIQSLNNMFNRMKKQAGKVGANNILVTKTKKGGKDKDQHEGKGVVFYCPKLTEK